MKLTDLDPDFISNSAGERIGIGFLCPACREQKIYVPFNDKSAALNWKQTGDTFDTLTLKPSVDARHVNFKDSAPHDLRECRWHGFITNGEVTTC